MRVNCYAIAPKASRSPLSPTAGYRPRPRRRRSCCRFPE
jgi:hypothetical protein